MTITAQITSTGIVVPTYESILAELQTKMRTIYGADIVLTADSQDGQMLAIFAAAINDSNQTLAKVFQSFSPTMAQGAGLSSVVQINGLKRLVSSRSTAVVTIIGQGGTVINNGIIGDNQGLNTRWALPVTVIIPLGGEIDVTATCEKDGAVSAAAASLTEILTPTRGWQTVSNDDPAVPGAPVENDAILRRRQSVSTALPAQAVLAGIYAAVANLPGVVRLAAYENDTGSTDGNGIPAHSISMVVEGGDVQQIGSAIALKKTPGTGTYGTTDVTVIDTHGVPNVISFFELAIVQIDVEVNITALAGFVSPTTDAIKAAVAFFISSLDIGEDSYYGRLWSPANLSGEAAIEANGQSQAALDELSRTYKITSVRQCVHGGSLAASDVAIAFNAAAACIVGNITVNVT